MKRHLLLLIALVLLAPASVQAQGIIIGPDARAVALDLTEHRVDAEVQERVAVVTVAHTFRNTGGATVEGTFLFPLPPEAQVSNFSMTVDGTEMAGELLSAEEARRIYEDIVRRSLDPALLELADYRTFRARVFPIPPGAERTITLRYDATLPADDQTAVFRYPLQGNLSHRAVGGPMPRPTPRPMHHETTRPVHDRAAAQQTLIRVNIASANGVRNVYSPSHEVDVRRPDNRHAEAVYEAGDALDGRDFVLYYRLDASEIGMTLLSHRPYRDRPGYFMMLFDPPVEIDEQQVQPQDVVFVLDTSGSMKGEKMEQARAAMRYCLGHLGRRDRFGLVAFSTDVDAFRDDLRPAPDHDDALYFVDQLEARGGTNIDAALLKAMEMLADSEQGLVVFLTDGLPSVGETDEAAIRTHISAANGQDVRIFSFGVGYDVNTRLLDGLSGASGAFADYISPEENIETRIAAFFDKVRYPVMTDLDLDITGGDVYALAPNDLPDLYKGGQLILAGRYRNPGRATVTLRGRLKGEAVTRRYQVRLPETARERDFVARLWATRRVGQLLESIRLNGENEELKEEVVALAKEFGLVTPYTSYLVQEEEMMAGNAPGRLLRQEARPSERVFGVSSEAAMDAASGSAAVEASKQIRALREADAAPGPSTGGFVTLQGRTLRATPDGWVDVAYEDGAEPIRLQFASDAYFAFLRRYPDAGPFARLGDRVLFRFNDRWVQIGETGRETLSDSEMAQLFG